MNTILSDIPGIDDVIEFIRIAHGDQKRIHGGPYYAHPVAVAEIVYHIFVQHAPVSFQHGNDLIIAALLHDTLEDCNVTEDELRQKYGDWVTDVVKFLTKPPKDPSVSKEERAKRAYERLMEAPEEARLIKIADRLHNLSEMAHTNRKFQEKYIKDTELLITYLKGTPQLDVLERKLEEHRARLEQEGIAKSLIEREQREKPQDWRKVD